MVHQPRIKPYLNFFLIAVIAITGICYLPLSETRALGGKHLIVRILLPAIDAAMLLMPYWLLPRRLRWSVLIPVWVLAFWYTGCIWYYRFWVDFPDITSIFLVDNFNSELVNSVTALWQWRDLGIIALAVTATIYYCYNRKRIETGSPSGKQRLSAIIATIVLYFVGQVGYSSIMRRYFNSEKVAFDMQQATYMRLVNTNSVQTHSIRINGFLTHYIASAIYAFETFSVNRTLTVDEVNKIDSFIANSGFTFALSDSLQEANSTKNIILIVVESLNSSVIGAECKGKPVAPTLTALNSSDSVFSALSVETQTRFGGSGDGQLLANTGLYPLPRFSTSILLGSKNTFPGLPKLLGRRKSLAIFADANQSWNENETFKNFGFDRTMCNLDYEDALHKLGSDAAMFHVADSIIPTLTEPFFLELLTTSMHIPFEDPEIPQAMIPEWITLPDSTVGPTEKYFRMVNYFDTALAGFIKSLKKHNLYDNTLIFIVSDHAQNVTTGNRHTDEKMTFMAVNSGIGAKVTRPTGQIDVFPTILQLAGVSDSIIWKGAGASMLGPAQAEQHIRLATEISKLILRGDYFKGKICNE